MTEGVRRDSWHENPAANGRGPEPDVLPVRAIAVAVACFVVFGVVMHYGLWYFVRGEAGARAVDRAVSAVPEYGAWRRGPALQPSVGHDLVPRQDLEAMRVSEDRVFAGMGWGVDEGRHRVVVPEGVVRKVVEREGSVGKAEGGRQKAEGKAVSATSRVVTPVPGVDQGGGR